MPPLFVARLECLFNKQSPEARAIQEEVSLDHQTRLEFYRLDKARLTALVNPVDNALEALHTLRFAEAAKVFCVQPGIEVVSVAKPSKISTRQLLKLGKFVPLRCLVIQ